MTTSFERYAVIVDPYSSGNQFANEFTREGVRLIAVLSCAEPAQVYAASYRPQDFFRVYVAPAVDLDELADELRGYLPICVLTGCESGVELAERLAPMLLPQACNGLELALARRDKGLMAAAVSAAGVPMMKQICTDDFARVQRWRVESDLVHRHLVVKPPKSASTDGVSKVSPDESLQVAFMRLLHKPNRLGIINDRVLVQEYLAGAEYVVDTFSYAGVHTLCSVCKYTKLANGNGMAIYDRMEWISQDDPIIETLATYAEQVLDALDIAWGNAHIEIMQTVDGPRLIELGARPHGGGHPALCAMATGDSQVHRAVRYFARGVIPPKGFTLFKHMTVVFFRTLAPCVVRNLERLHALATLRSYVDASIQVKEGQAVPATQDLFATLALGFVVLANDDPLQLAEDVELVRQAETEVFQKDRRRGMPTSTIQHAPGAFHEVRGKRLWVEQAGDGQPLMLLSGLGPAGSHALFHPHFDSLHADFRVIYVDLFGRGRSDKPDDLSDISFAQDVLDITALISKLCPEGAHLFGFSYGGLIGLQVALDRPDLVRSLLLCNSLHSPQMWQQNHENINQVIATQLPHAWEQISQLHAEGEVSTSPRMQALFGQAATLVRFYDPANASKLFSEPGSRNTALYPLFCGPDVDFSIGGELLRIPDFRPLLEHLVPPTKVLAGRFDRALYPALQLGFKCARVELVFLEHSGSFGFIEDNEEVLGHIRAHCQ